LRVGFDPAHASHMAEAWIAGSSPAMTSVLDTGARFSTVMPGLDPGIHGKKSCEDPDCTVIRAALDVSRKYSAFCQGCGIFCQDGPASSGYG